MPFQGREETESSSEDVVELSVLSTAEKNQITQMDVQMTPTILNQEGSDDRPEFPGGGGPGGMPPEGFGGEMPEGFDGEMPEDFDPSKIPGGSDVMDGQSGATLPAVEGSDSQNENGDENSQSYENSTDDSSSQNNAQEKQGRDQNALGENPMDRMPGAGNGQTPASSGQSGVTAWIWMGVSVLVLGAGLLVVKLYRI